jgi:hypothetical protein
VAREVERPGDRRRDRRHREARWERGGRGRRHACTLASTGGERHPRSGMPLPTDEPRR